MDREAFLSRLVRFVHGQYGAWIVLLIVLFLTISAYFLSAHIIQKNAKERFILRTKEVEYEIKDHTHIYEQVLWSVVGLMYSTNSIDRQQFAKYVETIDVNSHWRGIQGIGFSVPVQPKDLEKHIQEIRSQGFPKYSIKPEGKREVYSAIIYLEPFDWRNQRAFGYDMWSNEVRREAMARSRDEGKAATSGYITLVQETNEDVQPGFLTYVPVYKTKKIPSTVEERRKEFIGWVYAPFRAGDLFQGILAADYSDLHIEIYDGKVMSKETLLYANKPHLHLDQSSDLPEAAKTIHLNPQGRTWTLYIQSTDAYLNETEKGTPQMVAIVGGLVNVLLFYVIYSLSFIRQRAEVLARTMTVELEQAKQNLEDQVNQRTIELKKAHSDLENQYNILENTKEALTEQKEWFEVMVSSIGDAVIATNAESMVTFMNHEAEIMTGWSRDEVVNKKNIFDIADISIDPHKYERMKNNMDQIDSDTRDHPYISGHTFLIRRDGSECPVDDRGAPIRNYKGEVIGIVMVFRDMTEKYKQDREREALEIQLRTAQKLEAIGQLAAGIAHEINTPTQYIGDNTQFLQDSFGKILLLAMKIKEWLPKMKESQQLTELVNEIQETYQIADVNFLNEEIPLAISQSLEGVSRVSEIVHAMKEFAHPGGIEKSQVDINHALQTTLTVARSEWKYIADLNTNLDPQLPLVQCMPGEINQVFLNLIVNAAHAIETKNKGAMKGLLTISTKHLGREVEIRISDNGTGIPKKIQDRIFEPFFTTKEVGKGSGQGLSLAHSIIVEKHKGYLGFETQPGEGTTFIIRLPIHE